MNNNATPSVLEQTPVTEKKNEESEKSSANEVCKNQGGRRDHLSKSVGQGFKYNRILTAVDLTSRQGERLKQARDRGDPLTELQKASLERYSIRLYYNVPVTEAVLEFHDGGKGKAFFEIFQYVAVDMFPFTYTAYLSRVVSEKDWKVDLDRLLLGYLKEAFAKAGIFDLSSHTFQVDALYGPNSLQSFIDFVGSRPELFIILFNKEINQNLKEDPISQLVSLLDIVGLRHIQVKSNNGHEEVWYKLDKTIHDLLWTMTRAQFWELPYNEDEPSQY